MKIILLLIFIFLVLPISANAKRIYFNTTGGFDTAPAGASFPTGIAFDSTDNSSWVIDNNDDFVYHFDSSGVNTTGGFYTALSNPRSIAYDSTDNSFWITNYDENFVYHFDSNGVNTSGGFSISNAGNYKAHGITFDTRDNSFWITNFNYPYVHHLYQNGTNATGGFHHATCSGVYTHISFDATDNSFWLACYNYDFLYHYDSNGVNTTGGFNVSSAGTSIPNSIAFDTLDYSLWLTDFSNNFVYHFGYNETCTYTSGVWNIDLSDSCTISSATVGDGSNLNTYGTGSLILNAGVSGFGSYNLQGSGTISCMGGCFT